MLAAAAAPQLLVSAPQPRVGGSGRRGAEVLAPQRRSTSSPREAAPRAGSAPESGWGMAQAPPPKKANEAQIRVYLMRTNLYKLLGVEETALPSEIKRASRKMTL